MEQMYKELEEMRSAMELLTEECRAKSALSDRLKRAHDKQIVKLQEAKSVIEKQAKEIDAKEEEISVTKQMHEELGSKFAEKESALKHLSCAHENLRTSFAEKVKKLEGENKQLISALEEASEKGEEQDRVIYLYKLEIEKLKGLLSTSQMKCADSEKRAQAAKEVKRREEMMVQLEHEKGEVEDQLKWKIEQFTHLEEALDKTQKKFRVCRKEREMEKASLIENVSSLQTSLDSQTRIVSDLQSQLQMCNQALAREESRRKLAEMQMSESKALYENVMAEYEEVRLHINSMTAKRDKEIAELRNSLSTKSSLVKELSYKTTHLEQENEELRSSLSVLREAQIDGVDAVASFKNLKQKFKTLEQTHKGCGEKLKAREVEWGREREKLRKELEESLLNLNKQDEQVQELQVELEGCHSFLMQQKLENEEISVVLMIVKSKIFQLCTNLEDLKQKSEQYIAEAEERVRFLVEQLEMKNCALIEAQAEVIRERETTDSLVASADYSESIKQEYLRMEKEVDSYKGMLEELSVKFQQFKEQAACKENELSKDMKKALVALDQANLDLDEKSSQLMKVELELEQSKLVVERIENMKHELEVELNKYHEEILKIGRDLEDTLLAKVEAEKELEEGKKNFRQTLEDKDQKISELQRHFVLLEEDKRELEASFLAKLESENELSKDMRKALVALDQANLDLDEKSSQLMKVEFELKQSKLVVERIENMKHELEVELNKYHEEILKIGRDLEDSLLAKVEAEKELEEGKKSFQQTLEDKDQKIEELQRHFALLEEDKRELEASFLAKLESENELLKDMRKALVAVDQANLDLDEKSSQLMKVKFELEQSKLVVEQIENMKHELDVELNKYHEEILMIRRELEDSLLAKVEAEKELEEGKKSFRQTLEDKDQKIEELQQHFVLLEEDKRELEASFLAKLESKKSSENQNKQLAQFVEDIDKKLRSFQKQVDLLEQNYILREIASLVELEEEKLRSLEVTQEKDGVIYDMKQQFLSYEQELAKFVEINGVCILDEQEINFRNMLIAELEKEIGALKLKTEFEEKLSSDLKNQIKQLEAKLSTVLSEKEKQQVNFENELELLLSKETALEVRAEELIEQMMEFGGLIENISATGEEVKRQWNKVEQINTNEFSQKCTTNGKLDDRNCRSPSRNKAEQTVGRRSPLKEYNC